MTDAIATPSGAQEPAQKRKYPTHEMPWFSYIANQLARAENLAKSQPEKAKLVRSSLETYVQRNAPSGSGVDCGTRLSEKATTNRIVLSLSYHHMNEEGMYDGWTEHEITVTPDFISAVDLHITGRDKNQIKDFLHDTYRYWLTRVIAHPALVEYIHE